MPEPHDWQEQLETMGQVRIGTTAKTLVIGLVVASLFAAGVIWVRFKSGDLHGETLVWISVAFAILIVFIGLFINFRYLGKELVVDREGVTLFNGTRLPWSDIDHVDTFRNPRGPESVRIVLTDSAWQQFQSSQNPGLRILNRTNQLVTRKAGIYVPNLIKAHPRQLAGWLNRFTLQGHKAYQQQAHDDAYGGFDDE